MELNKITGFKLTEILKRKSHVKLVFTRQGVAGKLELSFEGLLFETPSPPTDKKVERVEVKHVLGFKALTELRHQKLDSSEYKQLLIQMSGSTGEYKVELICAFKNYTLRLTTEKKKQTSVKVG